MYSTITQSCNKIIIIITIRSQLTQNNILVSLHSQDYSYTFQVILSVTYV
jgi:hypothetical protein